MQEACQQTIVYFICSYFAVFRYIVGSYRPEQSLRDCWKTLFVLHNETGNVWTHILGAYSCTELNTAKHSNKDQLPGYLCHVLVFQCQQSA
jgi:hypothetical protein